MGLISEARSNLAPPGADNCGCGIAENAEAAERDIFWQKQMRRSQLWREIKSDPASARHPFQTL